MILRGHCLDFYVSPRGQQAYIIGGSYCFTPRGFVR